MRSTKMSGKLVKCNIHSSDRLYTLFAKQPFTKDPIEIGQIVPKIQAVEGLQKQ